MPSYLNRYACIHRYNNEFKEHYDPIGGTGVVYIADNKEEGRYDCIGDFIIQLLFLHVIDKEQ